MEEKIVNEEKTENKDTKALVKKILVIAGNVVFYAIIIVLFLFSLMNINAGNGTQNFPNLFGKGMLSVESNSMERNNGGYHPDAWDEYYIQDIQKGDLVYDDVFNGDLNSLKIGDVITFYDAVIDNLNTHRIVYINVENGYVVTQGDYVITQYPNDSHYYDATMTDVAKNDMLTSDHSSAQIVQKTEIRGVVTGVNRGAGSVLSNIRQNWLFYFVLPIAAILLIEIVFVVKNFLDLRHEKNKASLQDDKEAMMAELEAEKEKMRQELLAELRAQQAQEATEQVAEAAEAKDKEERVEEKEEVEEAHTEEVEENEEPTEATDEE